jgi:putative protease
VKNFEEIALLQSLWLDGKPNKELILNYNMYTYNREAKTFWREKGIKRFTAPVELNYQELRTLGIEDCDMLVYGYLPLMVSAQCLFESTQGCEKMKPEGNKSTEPGFAGNLTDRLGKSFFVKTNCTGCYNIIYNTQALSLHKQSEEILSLKPRNIRLDFTRETAQQTKNLLVLFIDRYLYGKTGALDLPDYTTGHFKRGVD